MFSMILRPLWTPAQLKAEGEWLTLVLTARRGQDGLNHQEDVLVHLGWAQLGSLTQQEQVSDLQRESSTAVKRQRLSCKLNQQESVLLQKNNSKFPQCFQGSGWRTEGEALEQKSWVGVFNMLQQPPTHLMRLKYSSKHSMHLSQTAHLRSLSAKARK